VKVLSASNELARIQYSFRVEGFLNGPMQASHFFRCSHWPPSFLRQADSMFAGDRTTERKDLCE
jgi:hypothetical protein